MNIIAGKYKNKKLVSFSENTVPLSSRARNGIFNILHSFLSDENKRDNLDVLDLFAGSGAVGLEAISRGIAKSVTFVDNDYDSIRSINTNIAALGVEDITKVYFKNAINFIEKNEDTLYDMIFIMPPYGYHFKHILKISLKQLKDNGILILESDGNNPISEDILEGTGLIGKYTFSRVDISIFKKI